MTTKAARTVTGKEGNAKGISFERVSEDCWRKLKAGQFCVINGKRCERSSTFWFRVGGMAFHGLARYTEAVRELQRATTQTTAGAGVRPSPDIVVVSSDSEAE
jgi:hypothetical protein